MKRVGALIEFVEGMSANAAQSVLDRLTADGVIGPTGVQEYDPEEDGVPAWYIP